MLEATLKSETEMCQTTTAPHAKRGRAVRRNSGRHIEMSKERVAARDLARRCRANKKTTSHSPPPPSSALVDLAEPASNTSCRSLPESFGRSSRLISLVRSLSEERVVVPVVDCCDESTASTTSSADSYCARPSSPLDERRHGRDNDCNENASSSLESSIQDLSDLLGDIAVAKRRSVSALASYSNINKPNNNKSNEPDRRRSSGRPRRSSSAVSVESHSAVEISEELLDEVEPNRRSLKEYNERRRSSWVNFGQEEEQQDGAGTAGGVSRGTFLQRKVTSMWHQKDLSWLDFDDEDDADDASSSSSDFVPAHDSSFHASMHGLPRRRRKVKFGGPSDNVVYHTLTRSEYTEDEKYDCWYDEIDHEDMQIDLIETVREMRSGAEEDIEGDEELCFRGLEHMSTPETNMSRTEGRRAVVRAVLEEQERQRSCTDHESEDSFALVRASTSLSEGARNVAEIAGGEDAAMARRLNFGGGSRRSSLR